LKRNHIRGKVNIATKLPLFTLDDFDPYKLLDTQLKRLDTDHIDFYLFHNMNEKKWNKIKQMGILKFIDDAKASGKIGRIGFSTHTSFDGYKAIIDDYPWEFSQIQLNIMDTEYQAGLKGLEYAASKNMPVVIMEPLKGGQILSIDNPEIEDLKAKHGLSGVSIAKIALDFLFDRSEILCVLSGMGRLEQVEENIKTASAMTPGRQPENEKAFIRDFKAYILTKNRIDCTACRYCTPGCPAHILIPGVFELYNNAVMYNSKRFNKVQLDRFYQNVTDCTACGQCESVCPQQLKIPELIKQIISYLSE
jgi:predicted aldo/keto reductase-like oxidoreductase